MGLEDVELVKDGARETMSKRLSRVLVTGGAGFIGSHTVDLLVEEGYEVVIVDNLEEQVHGGRPPEYLNPKALIVFGDVRDGRLMKSLVKEVDAIIHLAAAVGVGQSMYQVEKYVSYNTYGTAALLDALVNVDHGVKKLIVASSMSIYGEGSYLCDACDKIFNPSLRDEKRLRERLWEHPCPDCGNNLKPIPTSEDKLPNPNSIYAQTKRHQEEACLLIGRTYGIPTVALRYFNVYGPRQSLSNPYTGVCAVFINRVLNRRPPYIFEDGEQLRDFVYVKDVARANLLALEKSGADYRVVNVGSGVPTSISKVSEAICIVLNSSLKPYISNRFRKGDVRHCYADISLASKLLEFKPRVAFKEGIIELASWALKEGWGAQELFEKSLKELEERGLVS